MKIITGWPERHSWPCTCTVNASQQLSKYLNNTQINWPFRKFTFPLVLGWHIYPTSKPPMIHWLIDGRPAYKTTSTWSLVCRIRIYLKQTHTLSNRMRNFQRAWAPNTFCARLINILAWILNYFIPTHDTCVTRGWKIVRWMTERRKWSAGGRMATVHANTVQLKRHCEYKSTTER